MTAAHLVTGAAGEDLAAAWYAARGYEVVRNWTVRTPEVVGEIDIVATAPGIVVFCEVKTRSRDGFGGPLAAVDLRKQRRLRTLALAWLVEHRPGRVEVRFDVAAVLAGRLTVLEAAF